MNTLLNLLENDFCVLYDVLENHNGNSDEAKKLINMVEDTGANGIIFHRKDLEIEYTKYELSLARNDQNSYGKTIEEHVKSLEFDDDNITELIEYCHKKNLLFGLAISSESALSSLFPDRPDFVMIKHPQSTDEDFIRTILDFNIPIILEHIDNEIKPNILKNLKDKVFFILSNEIFCDKIMNSNFFRHDKLIQDKCRFGLYNKFKNNSLNIMSLTKGSEIFIMPATRNMTGKGDYHKFSNEKEQLKFMTELIRWCAKILGLRGQGEVR